MATTTKRRRGRSASTATTVAKTQDLSKIETKYEEEYDDRPPTAGVHPVFITNVREFEVNFSKKNNRYYNNSVLDLRVTPEADDESAAGRALMFQRMGHYQIRNIFKSAEVRKEDMPGTAQETKDELGTFLDDETVFWVKIDWEAFDTGYYNSLLVEATETDDVDRAKKVASSEQKATAAKAATLATTMTDFDDDGHGGYIPTIVNPETGQEVTARAKVRSVVVPTRSA